jgi:hypothetical protein
MAERNSNEHPDVNGHPPEDSSAAEISEVPPDGGLPFDEAVEQNEGPGFE